MSKIEVSLGSIQKTLFMPVWARAVETKKTAPVLTDEMSVRIIDSVNFDFSTMTTNLSEISQIAWIARCKRFDLVIQEFINRNPDGIIVNIGCGLDTTYERIGNNSISWFDLDLPDVIELRKKFITESDNRKFIANSFINSNWLDVIPKNKKVLIIATGVFVYFEENVIKEFIIKTADTFFDIEYFFDVTSVRGVKIANQVIEKSGLDKSSFFKWGLSDKSVIMNWDNRIKLISVYYTFKIKGLRMSSKNKFLGFLSDAAGVQYMLHLAINKSFKNR